MSAIRSGCRGRKHGTRSAYDHYGCRCADAREAARLYHKRRREGRQPAGFVPAVGAIRRVRALMALGWPRHEIARRLGWKHADTVDGLMRHDVIRRSTHQAVCRIYDELCMTPGPAAITKGRALAAGYRPPLAWDDIDHDPEPPAVDPGADSDQVDPVAVALAVAGEPPETLRDVDRRAAVAELVRRGESTTQIADKLGITREEAGRARDTVRTRQRRNKAAKTPNARGTLTGTACVRGNSTSPSATSRE